MGKRDNLTPFTKENAQIMGRKGGKISAKKREEHRAMALSLRTMMDHYLKAPKDLEGTFPKDVLKNTTVQDIALLRIVRKAVDEGDVSAMTFIRNTMGEDPKDQFNNNHTTTFSYSEGREELERLKKTAIEVSFKLKVEMEDHDLHPDDVEYINGLLPRLEETDSATRLKATIQEGEEMVQAIEKLFDVDSREQEEDGEDKEEAETSRGVWLDGSDVSRLFEIVKKARDGEDVLGDLEELEGTVKATLKKYEEDEIKREPTPYSVEELDFNPLDDYDEELFEASEVYVIAHGLENTVLSWMKTEGEDFKGLGTLELIERCGRMASFHDYYLDKAFEKGILPKVEDKAPQVPTTEEDEPFLVISSKVFHDLKGGMA